MEGMSELEPLNDAELLTLAGLARLLVRLDGRLTPDERRALAELGDMIAAPSSRPETADAGPYRDRAPPLEPLGADAFFELVERAARELSDEAQILAAARAVARPDARAAIHALLHHVAMASPLGAGELRLLDWLAVEWELEAVINPRTG